MCTMPMEQLFLKLKWMSSQERFRYSGSTSSMTVDKGTIKMSFEWPQLCDLLTLFFDSISLQPEPGD